MSAACSPSLLRLIQQNVLAGFNQEEGEKVNDAQWEINL